MAACPNCGRQTMRTEDWACQWCGYPLLGRNYKKIDKTFRQLQEERRLGLEASGEEPEAEVTAEAAYEAEPEPEPEPRPQPKAKAKPEPKPAPKRRPEPEPEPEPEEEEEFEPEAEVAAEAEPEPEPEPAPPTSSRMKPPPRPELKLEPPPPAEPPLDPKPILAKMEAASGAVMVSLDEINAAYQSDKLAAHTRLTDKVLTITGVVERIFVKEHLDIRYIVLTGTRRGNVWNVRCTFEKENAGPLGHLTEKNAAAVRGKYDGYGNNIILKDCAVIS